MCIYIEINIKVNVCVWHGFDENRCTHAYICIHICVNIYIYLCMHIDICTRIYIHIYMHIYICIYIYKYLHRIHFLVRVHAEFHTPGMFCRNIRLFWHTCIQTYMKVHTSTKFVTCQSFVSVSLFVRFFCKNIRLVWHKFMQTYKQVHTSTKSVTCQSFASVLLYVGLFRGFSPPKNRKENMEIQGPCAEIFAP